MGSLCWIPVSKSVVYNVLQGGIFLLLSVGAVSFYITYVCTGSPWFIYGTLSLLLLMAMYAGHYRVRMRRRFNIIVSFIFITTLLHSCSTLTLFSFNRPVTWFIAIPLSCTTFIPSMEICFEINLFWACGAMWIAHRQIILLHYGCIYSCSSKVRSSIRLTLSVNACHFAQEPELKYGVYAGQWRWKHSELDRWPLISPHVWLLLTLSGVQLSSALFFLFWQKAVVCSVFHLDGLNLSLVGTRWCFEAKDAGIPLFVRLQWMGFFKKCRLQALRQWPIQTGLVLKLYHVLLPDPSWSFSIRNSPWLHIGVCRKQGH